MTKGFITIATGDEHYYRMALELLKSYRFNSDTPLPFTILCDSENEYTKEFDDVRILKNATRSYLDKLEMFDYLPYDINIFIDADCLVYRNINRLFDVFDSADDFSCFGRVLPLNDKTGWFNYEDIGDLQAKVDYIVGLHGGIYYMRKTDVCRNVFLEAKEFAKNYEQYKFKGHFKLGDEPLLALSMAVNKCKPIPHDFTALICYWEYENQMQLSMKKRRAYCRKLDCCTDIVHWGTRFTRTSIYKQQVEVLWALCNEKNSCMIDFKYGFVFLTESAQHFTQRVVNRIKRVIQ